MFDMKGDGNPQCYAWPKRGTGVMFLALDVVNSDEDLFGDFTANSGCGPGPNYVVYTGYCALGWYTLPAQGGHGGGALTPKDAIWSYLRLWNPDHCWDNPTQPCKSIPSELHTLDSVAITSLSVMYGPSWDCDAFGTCFKYWAQLNPKAHDMSQPSDAMNERRSWDVYPAVHP